MKDVKKNTKYDVVLCDGYFEEMKKEVLLSYLSKLGYNKKDYKVIDINDEYYYVLVKYNKNGYSFIKKIDLEKDYYFYFRYVHRQDYKKHAEIKYKLKKYPFLVVVDDIPRHSKELIKIIKKYGKSADSKYCNFRIVTIDENRYIINKTIDNIECIITPNHYEWIYIEKE